MAHRHEPTDCTSPQLHKTFQPLFSSLCRFYGPRLYCFGSASALSRRRCRLQQQSCKKPLSSTCWAANSGQMQRLAEEEGGASFSLSAGCRGKHLFANKCNKLKMKMIHPHGLPVRLSRPNRVHQSASQAELRAENRSFPVLERIITVSDEPEDCINVFTNSFLTSSYLRNSNKSNKIKSNRKTEP